MYRLLNDQINILYTQVNIELVNTNTKYVPRYYTMRVEIMNTTYFCVFDVDIAYSYFVIVQYRFARDVRVFVC